jgi:hypothetical protein
MAQQDQPNTPLTQKPLFIPAVVIAVILAGGVLALTLFAPADDDDTTDTAAQNDTSANDADTGDADRLNDAFASDNNSLDTSAGDVTTFDGFAPIRVELPPQTVAPGEGTLTIRVDMPDGYKLNAQAPLTASLSSDTNAVGINATWASFAEVTPPLPLEVPLTFNPGASALTGELTIYWCEAINETLCFVDDAEIIIPVTVDENATTTDMTAAVELVPPEF